MVEAVVWLLLLKEQKIFLLQKEFKHNPAFTVEFRLIGGDVQNGENLKQALKREVYEEVDVIVEQEDLNLKYVIDRNLEGVHKMHFFFITTHFEGIPYNKEPHIHISGEWYSLDNLPSNIGPLAKQAIGSLNNDEIFGEYGW